MAKRGKTHRFFLTSIILHTIVFFILTKIVIIHPEYQNLPGIEFDFIEVYQQSPEKRVLPKIEQPQADVSERPDASQESNRPKMAASTFSISLTPVSNARHAAVMPDAKDKPANRMAKTNFTSIGVLHP